LHALQELGGWASPAMVQKYAHLSSEHLAQWVDRKPAVLVKAVPESGTFLTTGKEKGVRLLAYPLDLFGRHDWTRTNDPLDAD